MQKFDPKRKCPKCGANPEHIDSKFKTVEGEKPFFGEAEVSEVIVQTCGHCKATWNVAPLDTPDPE